MIKCNLKLLMAKKNITRKELSEETDIGLNSIGRYINNEFVKFDKEHMDSLCKYFDCSISDLITFENEDKTKDDFYLNTLKTFASSLDSEIHYLSPNNINVIQEDEDDDYIVVNEEGDKVSRLNEYLSKDEYFKNLVLKYFIDKYNKK